MKVIKPRKQVIETVKTVTIAILVTAIVAFICGMAYANKQHSEIDQAVKSATSVDATPLK